MKKIIVLATMTIAISAIFCACNGSTSANTDQDSKETADVEAIVDEDLNELMGEISADVEAKDASALQSSIEAFKARIQALINAGNGEVAQKYLQSLQEFLETNKEEVTAISATVAESADASIADLVQKVAALPLDVAEGATKAAEGVANAAANKANEAVQKLQRLMPRTKPTRQSMQRSRRLTKQSTHRSRKPTMQSTKLLRT